MNINERLTEAMRPYEQQLGWSVEASAEWRVLRDAKDEIERLRAGWFLMIDTVERSRCRDSLEAMFKGLDAACSNARQLLDEVP